MRSNQSPRLRRLGAAVLGWALLLAVMLGLATTLRQAWQRPRDPWPDLGTVLDGGLAAVGLSVCGWIAVGGLAGAATHLPGAVGRAGRAAAAAVTPRVARRLVAVLAGTAIGAASAGSAVAAVAAGGAPGATATVAMVQTSAGSSSAGAAAAAGAAGHARPAGQGATGTATALAPAVDPAWVPTRPGPDRGSTLLTPAPRVEEDTTAVVVRRGDTLWGIAARHLGPGATDAEVARSWPRWYAENRAVIGADPDRLAPGTRLLAPSAGEDR